MEVGLKMNGGYGKSSYAQNSFLQKKAITMTAQITEETVHKMIRDSFPAATYLSIADLGCGSGPNTLTAAHELVKIVHMARTANGGHVSPINIQVFLNDLPENDFNSVFKELPSFMQRLKDEIGDGVGGFSVHATPGSFYGRLYQTQSLHLVHSSYSLHWLSQVPKGIMTSNKGRILVSSGSTSNIVEAYYKQFQTDFATFLNCRSEELMSGGCMILTLLGRSDDASIKGSGYIWELLGLTLNQMVIQGIIVEEALHTFNVPLYTPSPSEIELEIKKEGSFEINLLQVSELDWGVAGSHIYHKDSDVDCVTDMMRAVSEPMMAHHFGQGLMNEVFKRYGKVIGDFMDKERSFFTNVTMSLTKIRSHKGHP